MTPSFIIMFREIFEIAIIVCVILAATKGVPGRGRWVSYGILGGIVGALALGVLTQQFASLATPETQKLYHAGILFLATALIAWTVIWMKQHGQKLAQHLKQVGRDVKEGIQPMHMLAIVVGLAVLREGSEIVLFLFGLMATGQTTLMAIAQGGTLGLIAGLGFGYAMYFGLIRVPIKLMFSMTSALLTFIAAGMFANGLGKLVASDVLPALGNQVWDTSMILNQRAWLGRFMHILLGYIDKPMGIQVLGYSAVVIALLWMPKIIARRHTQRAALAAA